MPNLELPEEMLQNSVSENIRYLFRMQSYDLNTLSMILQNIHVDFLILSEADIQNDPLLHKTRERVKFALDVMQIIKSHSDLAMLYAKYINKTE